jgi:hypothetical protein
MAGAYRRGTKTSSGSPQKQTLSFVPEHRQFLQQNLPKPLFLLFNKLEMIRIVILEFQRIKCTIVDTICQQC